MDSFTYKLVNVLLVFCVAACLITVGYHMVNQKYKTETAILSTADDSVTFKGVYVRDEQVVEYGGTGVVSYCVSDGGKLGSGSAVAEIYADEGQIDIKQQINDLNSELAVLKKIQNPGTLESAQPANIASLINEEYKLVVNDRERGMISGMSEQKNNLLVLMSTYQLVTNAGSDFQKRINEINSEISKLKASETVPLDTIIVDHSAYFVSYADGYEDKLKMDSLSRITPELIDEVQDSGPVEDSKVIGKLINGYEWYITGVIDNRKMNFSVDEEVKIKFQSTSEIADGEIYDIRETGDASKSVVIIKCDEITHDLVQHRTERVEMISGEFEGIKVPRKAIRFLNSEKGVYVKLGERISFKKIDVIYEGGDYVLSSLDAGDGYLALYDDIVVEGVESDGN